MSKPRRPRYRKPATQPVPAAAEAPDEFASVPAEPAAALAEPDHSSREAPEPLAFDASPAEANDDAAVVPALPDLAPLTLSPVLVAAELVTAAVPSPAVRRLGAEAIGTTVMNYVIGEGEAFAAHLRALAGAKTMGEFVRLQIGEFQRAADATLSCWGLLAMSASRTVSPR